MNNTIGDSGVWSPLERFQADVEKDKESLARTLHDDVGGMLVSVVMDVAWIERNWHEQAAAKRKLLRARQTLTAAIDLNRRLIEDIRPTLLDNVGLFAALRWHATSIRDDAQIDVIERYPESEIGLDSDSAIALYRIVQDGLAFLQRRALPTQLDMAISCDTQEITIRLFSQTQQVTGQEIVDDLHNFRIRMVHRLRSLGGRFVSNDSAAEGFTIKVPLSRITRQCEDEE
jgi:signal transduction histidine kinase